MWMFGAVSREDLRFPFVVGTLVSKFINELYIYYSYYVIGYFNAQTSIDTCFMAILLSVSCDDENKPV